MDCQMPVMDGYTATTELRRREGSDRHTPVIAMTAGALAENRDRCIAAGMDDFITKPVSQDALAAALSRWMPGTETPTSDRPTEPGEPAAPGEPGEPAEPVEPVAPPDRQTVREETVREEADEGVQPAYESIRRRLDEVGDADQDRDREMLTRIASMFVTRGQEDIEQLAEAVEGQDSTAIQEHAHRIKGAAANIGATAMSAVAKELEDLGRRQRPESAPDLLDRLRDEFDEARGALGAIVGPPTTDALPRPGRIRE
jgi:HPt (histidine-containing phosphotransfer) domain-containing protein